MTARQHFNLAQKLLQPLGLRIGLLTASTKTPDRKALLSQLVAGQLDLVIGTQALLNDDIMFNSLALVVIDEQHRFGVGQRRLLKIKAKQLPHLLSMTATPIPRSLALTLYGDLDISTIDELPPGRLPSQTKYVDSGSRQEVYRQIETELASGHQAYVVCPVIETTDDSGKKSVTDEYKRLSGGIFRHRRIGLLHGRLSSADKAAVMAEFAAGKLDMLVTTSVIEVGLDVPNATVMLIEGAERFGLAALHQLRGRVGRATHKSYVFVISEEYSEAAERRLRALEHTSDGFRLAELDLAMRGPGEIYGRAQHGLLDLRFATLGDTKLLGEVHEAAEAFVSASDLLQYPKLMTRITKLKDLTSLD